MKAARLSVLLLEKPSTPNTDKQVAVGYKFLVLTRFLFNKKLFSVYFEVDIFLSNVHRPLCRM